MKKAICIFLTALLMVFALCACKSGENSNPESTTEPTEFKAPDNYDSVLEVDANAKFNIYLDISAMTVALEALNEDATEIYNDVKYNNLPVENVVGNIITASNAKEAFGGKDKIKLIFSVKKENEKTAESVLGSVRNCIEILPEIEEAGISVSAKIKTVSEETTSGTETTAVIGETPCPDCNGKGKVQCDKCKNSGFIKCSKCKGKGYNEDICTLCGGDKVCTVCGGSGTTDGNYCVSCGGSKECVRCFGKGKEPCTTCNDPQKSTSERREGTLLCPECGGHSGEMCPSCLGTGVVIK